MTGLSIANPESSQRTLSGAKETSVTPLLKVSALCVSYDQFRALSDIDFEVGAGEIVAVIGANGAGKSTLLKSLIGQSGSLSGHIRFGGKDIIGRSTAETIASGIALVPEGRRLFPSLTVDENLYLGWETGSRNGMTLDGLYSEFPLLAAMKNRRAGQLSGGQQQLVAFGRALLANPKLLLCDEISLGLAPKIVDELYEHIPRIRTQGIAIVIVEQDVSRALRISDRFYCLLEGEVSLSGRSRDTSREAVTHAYFGSQ
jgi:branched-chain amino acid transport system ATP-binding protein